MFYTLIKHGFFDQSERTQGPIYILIAYYVIILFTLFQFL